MKKSVLKKDKKYTFSDYFELNNPTKEILEEFGYKYLFLELNLPETKIKINSIEKLRDIYVRKLPLISLNSEIAKREFYISPLLLEILDYLNAEINVEYPLDAGENLSGTVDYLIKYLGNIVIIEAKKGDLEKGFNQLAIELIAMDKCEETAQKILYGAITLGDIWRFGMLQREEKLLKKDMNAYIIPSDLERLLSILLGILEIET
ncbi:MAG: hypothetical protein HQK77_09225 [Desulfobacterales bacterium]|nr:hypothetical protein [Desulfobacterales bacterium]